MEIKEQSADRIIFELSTGEPFEIHDVTASFGAIARMYERHYRQEGEDAPKLFVTRLETGSILAEVAPYAIIAGGIIYAMDSGIIVSDFVNRMGRAIKAFSSPPSSVDTLEMEQPSLDDARDIREFTKPLVGRSGAKLSIKHARYENDGVRTVIEYDFDESELNKSSVNIERAILESELSPPQTVETSKPLKEVMLFFHQASRDPGKIKGRTVDRGIIPNVSEKPLPVYFRKSFQDLKTRMVAGEVNPLTNGFIVDVYVQYIDGDPKAYIIADVRDLVPLGDDGDE